jgi:hypothetical protein
MRIRF